MHVICFDLLPLVILSPRVFASRRSTIGLRIVVMAIQIFVHGEVLTLQLNQKYSLSYFYLNFCFCLDLVRKKGVYLNRLVQIFIYAPREQLTIFDFVFQ
jgi:hypothetical protein